MLFVAHQWVTAQRLRTKALLKNVNCDSGAVQTRCVDSHIGNLIGPCLAYSNEQVSLAMSKVRDQTTVSHCCCCCRGLGPVIFMLCRRYIYMYIYTQKTHNNYTIFAYGYHNVVSECHTSTCLVVISSKQSISQNEAGLAAGSPVTSDSELESQWLCSCSSTLWLIFNLVRMKRGITDHLFRSGLWFAVHRQ